MSGRAREVKQIILRNTSFALGRQLITTLVYLAVTPFVIRKLGLERFGIWAVTSAIVGYASLADFGIRTSFKKYIAQRSALGDRAYILRAVGNGVVYYTILGVALFLLALFAGKTLLLALKTPAEHLDETNVLLLLMALAFFPTGLSNVFGGVLEGMQRMDISNSLYVLQSVLFGIGIVAALGAGGGLIAMGATAAAATSLTAAGMFLAAQRVTGLSLRPWKLRLSASLFHEFLAYGAKLQGSTISMVGNLHLGKLLLAAYCGVEAVAVFEVGLRVAVLLRQIPGLVVSALVPIISELEARGEQEILRRVYEKGVSYVALIAVPLAILPLWLAHDLLQAWLGDSGLGGAADVLEVLAFAGCVAIVVDVPYALARGLGRLRYELASGIAHPVLHLGLGMLLVGPFAIGGVTFAQAAVTLIVAIAAFRAIHRAVGPSELSFPRLLIRAYSGPLRAALFGAAFALPVHLAVASHLPIGRGQAFLSLIASGSVFVFVYGIVALRRGILPDHDVAAVPFLGKPFAIWAARLGSREARTK